MPVAAEAVTLPPAMVINITGIIIARHIQFATLAGLSVNKEGAIANAGVSDSMIAAYGDVHHGVVGQDDVGVACEINRFGVVHRALHDIPSQ